MAPTNYTVASAATLLGSKPPKRREIEDVYFAQMNTADEQTRDRSPLQRTPEAEPKDVERKVRFTPSTDNIDGSRGARLMTFATRKALKQKGAEDANADRIDQAEIRETQSGTKGVASSFLISEDPASGPSNEPETNDGGSTSNKKAKAGVDGSQRRGQGAKKDDAGFWGAAAASSPAPKDRNLALPFAHPHRLNANLHAQHPTGLTRLDTSGGRHNDDDTSRSSGGGGDNSAAGAAGNAGYTTFVASATSAPAPASAPVSASVKGRHVADDIVFFTPVDVNRSTIEFEFFNAAAPMSQLPRVRGSSGSSDGRRSSFGLASFHSSDSSPPLLNRRASTGKRNPAQYRNAYSYDNARTTSSRRRSSTATTSTKRDKITVSPEQLDRLIVALANAPLVQTHLRKQWLEDEREEVDKKGNPSLLSLRSALRQTDPSSSDSTPSLTNNSTASDAPSDSSSCLYSRTNTTFVHEPTLDDDSHGDRPALTEHRLSYTRPVAKFGGIALTDPKVAGGPIRFVSKGYKKGANILQVGQCSFLNIPYSASSDCILRIEPGDIAHGGAACSVTIQVMAQVLERKKGKKVYLLVAEVDVTESLTKAVLVELSRHTGYALEDIEILRPEPIRHDSFQQTEEAIDWCALADELQATTSTNSLIATTTDAFAHLSAETCTMQTLTLLSSLERIKAQHVDFLVLRTAYSNNSNSTAPTSISVPWISQHLDRHVDLWSPEASALFREDLVAAVGRRHADGEPFAVRVMWGRKRKIVRCVPLLEGDEGRVAGHVAFIGDEFDF